MRDEPPIQSPLTVAPAKLISLIIQHDTCDDVSLPIVGAGMSGKTITRVDLCEAVYQKVGLSRIESATFVELVLKEITDCLERGETVKLSSFGSFVVRKKGQRMGRNPRTGKAVPIPPRRVMVFKPSAHPQAADQLPIASGSLLLHTKGQCRSRTVAARCSFRVPVL